MLALLQRDAELREVAAIVGPEALEDADRVTLAGAAAVRELVLGQSAFDAEDAFCAPAKTFALAQADARARRARPRGARPRRGLRGARPDAAQRAIAPSRRCALRPRSPSTPALRIAADESRRALEAPLAAKPAGP